MIHVCFLIHSCFMFVCFWFLMIHVFVISDSCFFFSFMRVFIIHSCLFFLIHSCLSILHLKIFWLYLPLIPRDSNKLEIAFLEEDLSYEDIFCVHVCLFLVAVIHVCFLCSCLLEFVFVFIHVCLFVPLCLFICAFMFDLIHLCLFLFNLPEWIYFYVFHKFSDPISTQWMSSQS